MAKRPSDLGIGTAFDSTWVIEADAADGATSTTETKKVSPANIYDAGKPTEPSFTTNTLVNGWTGECLSRVYEGYLEIFISVSPNSATGDTITTLSAGNTPDWEVRFLESFSSPNNIALTIDTSGNVSINDILGAPITINFSFKVIRLRP